MARLPALLMAPWWIARSTRSRKSAGRYPSVIEAISAKLIILEISRFDDPAFVLTREARI